MIAFCGPGHSRRNAIDAVRTLLAKTLSFVYFGFFFLMPWYSKIDSTKPVPTRVTG